MNSSLNSIILVTLVLNASIPTETISTVKFGLWLTAWSSTDFRDAIAGVQRRATSLCSDYKTGRLVGAAYVAWKPLIEAEAKVARDIVDFIQPISRGYHALYRFREHIIERSKLPEEFAALNDVANPDNLDAEPPLSDALRAQLLGESGTDL
ncbi:hypothetical protein FGADI_1343 [Fusarium gaditjirri]|uniref:Uncharacterized protein n=1 Tax=Fusarium gaditjirri TaxID=282569 RepID=A0A8H4X3B6_9HYPO|nr:hypothetical protein FGADI_1343 [Fusarium gaditjirri]